MSGLARRFWEGRRSPTLWASERIGFQTRWCLRERHFFPLWKVEILPFSSLQASRTFLLFESLVPEPLSQLLLLGVGRGKRFL